MQGMSIVLGAFRDSEELAKFQARVEDVTLDHVESPVLDWYLEEDNKMDEQKQPSVLSPRALEANALEANSFFPFVALQQEDLFTTPSSWDHQGHTDSTENNVHTNALIHCCFLCARMCRCR